MWLMLGLALGWAQNDTVDEEVVVTGHRELAQAREDLHQTLKKRRYIRVLTLGQRSWYLNPKIWKPGVMVHDQGFVRIRGRPVLPVGADRDPYTGIPRAVFVVQSARKRSQQKAELVGELQPHLLAIRDAHHRINHPDRIALLRHELTAIWFDGVAPDGSMLPDYRSRRAALVHRWLATSGGEAGRDVRSRVDAFIDAEVQRSEHPFRTWELEHLNESTPANRAPLAPDSPANARSPMR